MKTVKPKIVGLAFILIPALIVTGVKLKHLKQRILRMRSDTNRSMYE